MTLKVKKFGDGVQVKSRQNVVILAEIGTTKCFIDCEVVDSDIPLLLSKTSLKRAATLLDLTNDKVEMFHEPVQLEFTSSGQYCVDITCKDNTSNDQTNVANETLIFEDNLDETARAKILLKLHRQFGHGSTDKLKKLVNAGKQDASLFQQLEQVVNSCETCLKYKKPAPKPAVGFPLASDFNETVAVDLHQLGPSLWYLHIIDVFTRFSAATVITSKRPDVFVQKFIQQWISIHSSPKRLYSDNGVNFKILTSVTCVKILTLN